MKELSVTIIGDNIKPLMKYFTKKTLARPVNNRLFIFRRYVIPTTGKRGQIITLSDDQVNKILALLTISNDKPEDILCRYIRKLVEE